PPDTVFHYWLPVGVEEPAAPATPASPLLDVGDPYSIRYSLPSGEQGTISLYDPTGRRIESYKVQGEGQAAIKVSLPSGVYFIKLEAGKASVTKKAVVLR
ncbi:T9SS type A sorting domain-containing protein, partial [bacterium]|nr:T9SS type A sorting domain-containing protein [bacterium]